FSQRQTNAQAAFGLIDRFANLSKHLEHFGQRDMRDPYAVIFDGYSDGRAIWRRRERKGASATFGFAVLRRVMKEIRENLSEPDRVAVDENFFRRNIQGQLMFISLDERPDSLHRCGNDRG